MADRILVFIPCYNCEAQIGRVLGQFAGGVGARFAEILVLDNHSRDATVEAALAASDRPRSTRVTVARNRENYGLGGSHKAAFAYAVREGYSHVVTLHGDDQGHIRDLLPILDAGRHRRAAACLGARFVRGAKLTNYSAFRIFGNQVFNALFTGVTGTRVVDLGSGLNIFGPEIFAAPSLPFWSDDLRFNIFLLLDAIHRRLVLDPFPIEWREEDQVSNVRMASQAAATLRMLAGYALRRGRFLATDHRAVARKDYRFDAVG